MIVKLKKVSIDSEKISGHNLPNKRGAVKTTSKK